MNAGWMAQNNHNCSCRLAVFRAMVFDAAYGRMVRWLWRFPSIVAAVLGKGLSITGIVRHLVVKLSISLVINLLKVSRIIFIYRTHWLRNSGSGHQKNHESL
ncbi:hypothetical protein TNIN_23701 [Trichonephila inaurata madagascariensis]|uniref:Uncharacterized protein n=1 Tax=Trichonephila inaurata madagascariensis TaxID=2747483 RepID=A0A8X7CGR8_9ARAC|nr:hypothetical protein TNIN_23701 [Trichonephila inaurata madagascariensis]